MFEFATKFNILLINNMTTCILIVYFAYFFTGILISYGTLVRLDLSYIVTTYWTTVVPLAVSFFPQKETRKHSCLSKRLSLGAQLTYCYKRKGETYLHLRHLFEAPYPKWHTLKEAVKG